MKELGILFKADMIRAILAGRKTQTRRICKPQPDVDDHPQLVPGYMELENHWGKWAITTSDGESKLIKCRYGQPGDLLYCKETFIKGYQTEDEMPVLDEDGEYIPGIWFKATDPDLKWLDGETGNYRETTPWKSPLFLKKKDARIWLRNTGARVERLQDIGEEDAIAEGIESFRPVPGDGVAQTMYRLYGPKNAWTTDPRQSFRTLIQSIHGPEVWEENPWCFVIDFEVLSTTGRPKNV